jgi:uncharacterized lipoprotein YddW (UPF0748 family)
MSTQINRKHGLLPLTLTLFAIALAAPGCRTPAPDTAPPGDRAAPMPITDPVRAVWVARFHYHYPDDIKTIMANCAAAGCNTVYWQVRGEATVAYPSKVEPWAREYDHADPGFDPLAIAVDAAHQHGLRIEAWINVMPGWKGEDPPPVGLDPPQAYHAHPEWYLHDAAGRRQPLSDFYVILNPCLPEVRAHIAAVVREIVTQYDVDGIHLDYVRYAWDATADAAVKYPRDPRTLALYRSATGKRPDDDPRAWHDWRANQLTKLVARIRETIDQHRDGATLTAATWGNPERGYRDYLQNAVGWLRTGLLDAAAPMAYREDVADLAKDIAVYDRLAPGTRVVPGLGIYKHETAEQVRVQLAFCAERGGAFSLFSYESLFPTASDRDVDEQERARQQRLRHLRREAVEAMR